MALPRNDVGHARPGVAPAARVRLRLAPPFPAGAPVGEAAILPAAQPRPPVEEEFLKLAAAWREDTEHLSSASAFTHAAYQRIIGMGAPVVPLLLRDMADTGAHWFWALRAITGENPVRAEDAGSLKKMIDAWLAWGRARGLA